MKLWLLFLCSALVAGPLQERKLDPAALSELATHLNIAGDLIEESQKSWLRKAGQERWEMKELSPEQKAFVLQWAEKQGLFAAWKPACPTYDKALILGATTGRMQSRLETLKQLWEEGVRFKEVVWLTGDRPLDARVDGLLDRCSNESEAATIIWNEADLPEEMRQLPLFFVATPMKGQVRPNTADTIVAWLEVEPEPCRALFISDQPFCGYQFATIAAILPDAFEFDVAGRGADPTSHPAAAAITLDAIARWMYQEHSR